MKKKMKKVLDQPIRMKIAMAKDAVEFEFFHQAAKRYEGAKGGTVSKWLKAINAKRKALNLPTIGEL